MQLRAQLGFPQASWAMPLSGPSVVSRHVQSGRSIARCGHLHPSTYGKAFQNEHYSSRLLMTHCTHCHMAHEFCCPLCLKPPNSSSPGMMTARSHDNQTSPECTVPYRPVRQFSFPSSGRDLNMILLRLPLLPLCLPGLPCLLLLVLLPLLLCEKRFGCRSQRLHGEAV